jgi:hypothetical protein
MNNTGGDRVLCPVSPSDVPEVEGEVAQDGAEGDAGDRAEAENGENGEEEQANIAKPQRDPRAPSAAERAAHEATHLPFRSWCKECIAGRRDNPAHRAVQEEGEGNAIPEVAMDCFTRREEEEESVLTVLVLKDRASRAIQAFRVERKGVEDEDAISRTVESIRRFGHRGRILLKTDGEPAILALKERVMQKLTEGAIAVEPPPMSRSQMGGLRTA